MNIDDSYKALSDPTRRKILDLLKEKTMSAGDIVAACGASYSNISQHLSFLKKCEMIIDKKVGLHVYYSLVSPTLEETTKEAKKMISVKDKILQEIGRIAEEAKCELVLGADSQDDGTAYIMKGTATILSFHYTFRLSSFLIQFEIPSHVVNMTIDYQEQEKVNEFLNIIKSEIHLVLSESGKKQEMKFEIKKKTEDRLISYAKELSLFGTRDSEKTEELRKIVVKTFNETVEEVTKENGEKENKLELSEEEKDEVYTEIVFNITSLGKLRDLFYDDEVSHIYVNGYDDIKVRRNGSIFYTDVKFDNEDELERLVKRIANYAGIRLDRNEPITEAKLEDGTRIQIALKSVSAKGICMTVHKSLVKKLHLHDLVENGTISELASHFLKVVVKSKANILISGRSNSGKTTLLDALCEFIKYDERIVTVERQQSELKNTQHAVRLETRNASFEGRGEVTSKELIEAATNMDADRIILGDVTYEESFEFLQALNEGYEGSMASIIAMTPNLALERIANLSTVRLSPLTNKRYINEIVLNAIDLVVHVSKMKDGSFKVTDICQIEKLIVEDKILSEHLFHWNGKQLVYTGNKINENLKEKFERYDQLFEVPQEDDRKILLENQIGDLILNLADGLKAGYPLSDVIGILGSEMLAPMGEEFERAKIEVEAGVPLIQVIRNIEKRIDLPDFTLLVNAIIIQIEQGGFLEPVLRSLSSTIESNMEYRKEKRKHPMQHVVEFRKREEFMEFIDLLSVIAPSAKSLENAICKVCDYIKSDISTEFKIAMDEIYSGSKRRDVMNELARRIDLQEAKTFVSQINQSEVFGTGVERAITMFSERMRRMMIQIAKMRPE